MKRLLAFGLAVVTVFALSIGTVPRPAQAQVTLPGGLSAIVVDLLVEVDQGACTAEGCRNVTFDALLSVDETTEAALTGTQLADVEAALDAAVVEIRVTPSEGETRVIDDGQTVCLPPGETTVTATVLNADVVADAIISALGLDPDLALEGQVEVGSFSDTFDVADCPDDGGTPPPGDGEDPDDDGPGAGGGDSNTQITDQRCQNIVNIIISNNPQYANIENLGDQATAAISQEINVSPNIVQQCIQQVADDGVPSDEDPNGGTTDETTNGGTTDPTDETAGPDDGSITASGDQYRGVEITNIINVPDTNLPKTGGPSLLGIVFFTLAGAGLCVTILRRRS